MFVVYPLHRQGGMFLWQRMLRFGAANDSKEILFELSGGKFKPNYYMKDL